MARRDPFETISTPRARSLPFPFVLEELAPLDPVTRPMFGALGVYVGDRIVMILRDKGPGDVDSGVWLAFDPEHEAALSSVLPRLCPIELFRTRVAGWKKLAARSAEFEDDVGLVCRLLRGGDERIGKVPNQKRPRAARAEPAARGPTRAAKREAPGAKKAAPARAGSAKAAKTARTAPAKAAKAAKAAPAKSRAKTRS